MGSVFLRVVKNCGSLQEAIKGAQSDSIVPSVYGATDANVRAKYGFCVLPGDR